MGCADMAVIDEVHESTDDVGGTIVSLRLYRPGDGRAPSRSPQGGVYGDGFEPGNQWSTKLNEISYDYEVKDLCLFLLDTGGQSIEGFINSCPATTPFKGAYYVGNNMLKSDETNDGHSDHPIDMHYLSAKVDIGSVHLTPTRHRFIVVANVGNITSLCSTVGALRNVIATKGYTSGGNGNIYVNCENGKVTASDNAPLEFAMGLYEEPGNIQLHAGTEADPHTCMVTLERLSARVDFKLTQSPSLLSQRKDPFAPIPYSVSGKGGAVLAKNWITHVRLVNAVKPASYILRRTADDALGSNVRYLGFEQATGNKVTSNYVIDPFTKDKSNTPNGYFGGSGINDLNVTNFLPHDRVVSRKPFLPLTDAACIGSASAISYEESSSYDDYFIVGYPQENTLRKDQMTRDYTTGLLYRSIYEPATVWRYDGSGIASTTVSKLTTDVLSDGSVPAGGYKSDHYGKTFWMIERLVPNPTEADRAYFVADGEGDQDAEGVTTFSGREKIEAAVKLYIAAHNDTGWTAPYEYVNGVAYNYYWIRHSNSQGTGQPFSPMEYSIVRNNIYRIGITSFSGPGAPSTDPGMDNPDRIQPITYVHKWHPYTVKEVNM